jgi:hypothetical protein
MIRESPDERGRYTGGYESYEIREVLNQLPVESSEIPIERKMRALGGITLAKVESAYRSFAEFSSFLKKQAAPGIGFDQSRVETMRNIIEDALDSIKKQEQ